MVSTSSAPAAPRPLHAPLVHVPIGAVLATAVLDVISAAAGGAHPWARDVYRAGTFVLMIGTGVLFLAMIAGFIDRARFTAPASRPRRGVNRHAVVMTAVAVLCVAELIVRRNLHAGATSTPAVVVALSLAGAALTGIGGDLGGRLVYREGVGVLTAHPAPPEREPVA